MYIYRKAESAVSNILEGVVLKGSSIIIIKLLAIITNNVKFPKIEEVIILYAII
jgi:formate hydrogenlyase subunit 3/multisubunit Na+/H+ antiporter MnhD subunit